MPLDVTLTQTAQFSHRGLQFIAGAFTFAAPTNAPDAGEGVPFASDGTHVPGCFPIRFTRL